jgi:hypothetical protein
MGARKSDSSKSPPPPESEPAENVTLVSQEELDSAERLIAARMQSSLAFWVASLEAYHTMVRDWTQSRQAALMKSMKTMASLRDDESEGVAEKAADAMIDQWSSFNRDFLAVQMKTMAKANALIGKASEGARADDGQFRNVWSPPGEGMFKPPEPVDK